MARESAPTPEAVVKDVMADAAVGRALAGITQQADAITEEAVRIAEIPAPTFAETERASYTAERFHQIGLDQVSIDEAGNVYGRLPGEGRAAAAFLAHMDTVFPADVPHDITRRQGRLYGPGVGDNSAGLAGMLSAAAALAEGARPARPVWFVATVGEEGLGNLKGAHAATDRLGDQVDAMVAVEGSFFGRLSHTAVGSRRVEIACRGPGGHSWHDFGRPSATHVLARIAAAITELRVPADPRTTYNIGRLEGGIGVNVIAEEARLLLDMRSLDARALDDLAGRVRAIADRETTSDVRTDVREVGFRPAGAIDASHGLVRICEAVLRQLNVNPQYAPASTDANIPLSRGIPAVTLGVTRGGGAHTRAEWIDLAPMAQGVQQIVLTALALADPRTHLKEH